MTWVDRPLGSPENVRASIRIVSEALHAAGVRHVVHGSAALVLQRWPVAIPDVDLCLPRAPGELADAIEAIAGLGWKVPHGAFDDFWQRNVLLLGKTPEAGPFPLDLACHDRTDIASCHEWAMFDYPRLMRRAVRINGTWALFWRDVLQARLERGSLKDVARAAFLLSTWRLGEWR